MTRYLHSILALLAGLGLAALAVFSSAQAQPELSERRLSVDTLEADSDLLPPQAPADFSVGIWVTEIVDSAGDVGRYTSLELDAWGYPHISYYDATDHLRYTYQDSAGWHSEIVDPQGSGETALELDDLGYPHILYKAGASIKYAYLDTAGWHIETAEAIASGEISLALDDMGNPHVAYIDRITRSLVFTDTLIYSTRTGGSWNPQVVDTAIHGFTTSDDFLGVGTAIVLDQNGLPQIAYGKGTYYPLPPKYPYCPWGTGKSLKLASNDGSSWNYPTIAGGTCYCQPSWPGGSSPESLPQPQPDSYNQIPVPTICTRNGDYPSLKLFASGAPAVSHYGESTYTPDGSLKLITATVDAPGVGTYSSLALDAFDNIYISYYDHVNRDLKFAALVPGSTQVQVVDSQGEVGQYTSLELAPSGNPIISYYDATHGDLKIARYISQGVFLLPVEQSKSGERGSTVSYLLTLHNRTDITDSLALEVGSHLWDVQLAPNPVGLIPPGISATVTVSVSIPMDTQGIMSDTLLITASGVTSPGLYSNIARITTTFEKDKTYLPEILNSHANPVQSSFAEGRADSWVDPLVGILLGGSAYAFGWSSE